MLSTKRTFKVKYKAFFIIFKGLTVGKSCLRPESAPLKLTIVFESEKIVIYMYLLNYSKTLSFI